VFRSDNTHQTRPAPIPTPLPVRWRRIRYQLIPIVAVLVCSLVATLVIGSRMGFMAPATAETVGA